MRTITLTTHSRPNYLEQTLQALSHCAGIERYRVTVFCDNSPVRGECVELVERFGFVPIESPRPPNAYVNTMRAISSAFDDGARYHLHLEEDTTPTRGALLWFEWAERFGSNPTVFSISGYHQKPSGKSCEYSLRPWFTPWGFATWADRWAQVESAATPQRVLRRKARRRPPIEGWDERLNRIRKEAGLKEIYPCVSRIQNIGAHGGLHVTSPEWHAENHHARKVSHDRVTDFVFKPEPQSETLASSA